MGINFLYKVFLGLFVFITTHLCYGNLEVVTRQRDDLVAALRDLNIVCKKPSNRCDEKREAFIEMYKRFEENLYRTKSKIETDIEVEDQKQSGEGEISDISQDNRCSRPPSPLRRSLSDDIERINDLILLDKLKALGLDSYVKDRDIDEKPLINQKIGQYIHDHESELIAKVCKIQEAGSLTFEILMVRSKNQEKFLQCLGKISKLWENTPAVLDFLSKDKDIGAFLANHQSKMEVAFIVSSYLKNVRSSIAKSYFSIHLPDMLEAQLKSSGLSKDDLQKHCCAFGFNRLFSHRNSLGASPASDVDFKVVCDDQALRQKNPEFNFEQVKKQMTVALEQAKTDFRDQFALTLEVEKFTVKSKTEIENLVKEKNQTELNFYASILHSSAPLFGNQNLKDEVFNTVHETIKNEVQQRVWEGYIGPKSGKGSIGYIKTVESAEAPRKSGFEGHFIGMPYVNEKQHAKNYVFSTKYVLGRPYDFNPHHKKTKLLNDIGMNFQMLLTKRLHEAGHSQIEIDMRYDKITAADFSDLFKTYPEHVRDIIKTSCNRKLVSDVVCRQYEFLKDDTNLQAQNLETFGFRYFQSLFTTADQVGKEIKP